MSDRSSPEIFYTIYTLLAKSPTDEHKAIAAKMYKLSRQFDFSDYDVGADEAMIALDLAEKGPEGMMYGPKGARQ